MNATFFTIFMIIPFFAISQYTIHFDDMVSGPVSPQSDFIIKWPTPQMTDPNVTDEMSKSEPHSMKIAPNGSDDVVFLLGEKSSGIWSVSFELFVPEGRVGYWNIQDKETPAVQWNGNFHIGNTGANGSDGNITWNGTLALPYPTDEWFTVTKIFNLDDMLISVFINSEKLLYNHIYKGDTPNAQATGIGGICFFSISTNAEFYVDNFIFVEGELPLADKNPVIKNIKLYPNPVQNILQLEASLEIKDITIFNFEGKTVKHESMNAVDKSVNVASLPAGVYVLQVNYGNHVVSHTFVKE